MPTCVSSCVPPMRLVLRLVLRSAFPACSWAMAFDMGTVSPCSPLVLSCCVAIPFRFSIFRLAFSSRPASRFASRLCVLPCVPFIRIAVASRSASRFHCLSAGHDLTFVWGAVSFCLPLAVSPWRLVLGVCVPSCMPSLRFCLASCVSAFRYAFRHVSRLPACPVGDGIRCGTVPSCSPLTLPCRVLPCRA